MSEYMMNRVENLRPILDRVFIKPIQESEVSKGGIIMVSREVVKPNFGKVLAVGPGKRSEKSGDIIPMNSFAGATVMYDGKYAGLEVNFKGESCLMMNDEDVMAIVEG
jgi:chaperonin GroES